MCYAIPALVEEVRGNVAVISYFGERKTAFNELIALAPGDYVYAQGGYVISKVRSDEALASLDTWKDLFFELQDVDARRAAAGAGSPGNDRRLSSILEKAGQGEIPQKYDAQYLLSLTDPKARESFYGTANLLRQRYHKNSCCVHGIIELSNHCVRSCVYCGISRETPVTRYRMSREEVLAAAAEAVEVYGFKSLVLQSGEGAYPVEELAFLVEEIRRRYPCLIFVSFGEVGLEGLEALYRAGARGLLMRFETSNPKLYAAIHGGSALDTRLAHLRRAHELGYLILTGSLIGVPGQTREDLYNDIVLAGELHAEMFSFGPFLPHPNTPLAGHGACREEEVLGVLALSRLMAPRNAKILVTTAFETLSARAREEGLLAGANSLMLNVTPLKYRPLYSLYPHRAHEQESVREQIDGTIAMLKGLGRGPTDLGV